MHPLLLQVLDPELTHVYRDMTLGHYLDSKGYSTAFKYNYVLPMCAAVWSVPNATVGASAACRKCNTVGSTHVHVPYPQHPAPGSRRLACCAAAGNSRNTDSSYYDNHSVLT